MGIAERKSRIKERTRKHILNAAINIAKTDGWKSLTMRKIAEHIEYTAPMIYERFRNKNSMLSELAKLGFQHLKNTMDMASQREKTPELKLKQMWMAYWDFAFAEKEFYELMFCIGTCNFKSHPDLSEFQLIENMIKAVLREINGESEEGIIAAKFYTCWSAFHGLITLNLLQMGMTNTLNLQVLNAAINDITNRETNIRQPIKKTAL